MQRPALWSDLIHNCNIDFLKNASFGQDIRHLFVFKQIITIIQIDNTERIAKTIRKYQGDKKHLIHILSRGRRQPVENSD
ncbi:hypothetical protein A5320_18605 [Rheinheimera sp. SA_1]|nr:hypothetical protein A5320_18605 [Rheinheimera sp. SA_1]